MALQFGSTKIGAMQYNGVTIGEAMMDGQIVYSAMSWPAGFYIGGSQMAYTGQWVGPRLPESGSSFIALPNPNYPDTRITGDGISVPAGRYTITAQVTHAVSTSYLKGVRATLNGTPISGLLSHATSTRTVSEVSATVTIGAGIVSMEKYDAQWYARTGLMPSTGAPYTWLTITPA